MSSTWERQTLPLTPSARTTRLKEIKRSAESGPFTACSQSDVASCNSRSKATWIKWDTTFKKSSHPRGYLSEDLLPWFALEVLGQTHLWMRHRSVLRAAWAKGIQNSQEDRTIAADKTIPAIELLIEQPITPTNIQQLNIVFLIMAAECLPQLQLPA